MSNEQEPLSEFERLLNSVSPAEPKGNPMQIMYLAGQQTAYVLNTQRMPNRVWKLATFVSSSVAAGLLVFLSISHPSANSTARTNEVEIADSNPSITTGKSDVESTESRPQESFLSQDRSVQRLFDPLQIAQAQRPRRSIDIFDDFEFSSSELSSWKKEPQR